jgi:hypothetical protein
MTVASIESTRSFGAANCRRGDNAQRSGTVRLTPVTPPCRRRYSDESLERSRESRLGVVTHIERDCSDRCVRVSQQAGRDLHAPVRKILHRRLPDELDEPLV